MADVVNGWLMSNVLDSAAEAIKRRKAEEKQNELASLAAQAYSAPEDMRQERLNALAQRDTGAAFGMEQNLAKRDQYTREMIEANRQDVLRNIGVLESLDPISREREFPNIVRGIKDPMIRRDLEGRRYEEIADRLPQIKKALMAQADSKDPAAVRTANYWREMYANGTPEEKIIAARQLRLLSGPGQLGFQATGDGYYVTDPNRGTMTPAGMGQVGAASMPPPAAAPPPMQAPRVTTPDQAYNVIGDEAFQIIRQKLVSAVQSGQIRREDAAKELDRAMLSVANQMVQDANGGGGQPAPATGFGAPPVAAGAPRTPAQVEAQLKQSALDKESEEARGFFESRIRSLRDETARISSDINEAKSLTGHSTAGFGAVLEFLPVGPARRLAVLEGKLRANAGFKALEEMREKAANMGASSAASGLGQITEKELKFLQDKIAAMSRYQDPDDLRRELENFDGYIKNALRRVESEYLRIYGQQQRQPAQNGATRNGVIQIQRGNDPMGIF